MVTPSLFVFGCGHVGSAIVRAASALGFEITAIDELESNANSETLSQANTILNSYDVSDFKTLQFTSETIVLIATREHHLDQKILEFCLKQPFLFLGVIGSQRKAAMQRERLKAKGYDENVIRLNKMLDDCVHSAKNRNSGSAERNGLVMMVCGMRHGAALASGDREVKRTM